MAQNFEALNAQVQELRFRSSSLAKDQTQLAATLARQNQSIQALLTTQASQPAVPVANLLWNGDLGQSSHTWLDSTTVFANANADLEAAWWYSHTQPATAQTFTTITASNKIPLPNHNFVTGTLIDLTTTGTLPTGLAIETRYFVYVFDANTVQLATTIALAEAGTPDVTITTGTGTGTHTIQQWLLSTYSSDTAGSSVNNALKTFDHTTYDPKFSRWNKSLGEAELTGTATADNMLPSNLINATTPLARISLIAARKSEFIEIPSESLMFVGIWDNTSGQRKFLTGDVGFTATLEGTAGTVTRKYKVLLESDKGFSILSNEITIANAPADGEFSSTRNILMSWLSQAGQLQVSIYEYLPAGGGGHGVAQYRLLTQISSASSFIYEGEYLKTVSGYPTATTGVRTATYFTSTGDISQLAVNGVDLAWSTVNFPIGVPNNYNMANTTNRQWVRIGLTVAANLFITGASTDGSTTITIPSGAVDSSAVNLGGYGTGSTSLYAGLVAKVYDENDALLATTTVSSVTSNTAIVLAASVATGTNRKIRIVGGGFHGVFLDKVHLGYQTNTSYAPNAFDSRWLLPAATPTRSDQNTTGGGGSGGGVNTCCSTGTRIKMANGTSMLIEDTRPGQFWASGALKPNLLVKIKQGMSNIRRVRTANGCELICTDTEAFIINPTDIHGTPLYRLRVGDALYTEVNGRDEATTIVEISPYLDKALVFSPSLSENHLFLAGEYKPTFWQRMWQALIFKQAPVIYIYCHNEKPFDGNNGQAN